MCDCYTDTCRICGKEIEMHLGDYETDRGEIIVCHKKCFDGTFGWNSLADWKHYEDEGLIIVFCLTKRAWKNREGNSLNMTGKEIADEKEKMK